MNPQSVIEQVNCDHLHLKMIVHEYPIKLSTHCVHCVDALYIDTSQTRKKFRITISPRLRLSVYIDISHVWVCVCLEFTVDFSMRTVSNQWICTFYALILLLKGRHMCFSYALAIQIGNSMCALPRYTIEY